MKNDEDGFDELDGYDDMGFDEEVDSGEVGDREPVMAFAEDATKGAIKSISDDKVGTAVEVGRTFLNGLTGNKVDQAIDIADDTISSLEKARDEIGESVSPILDMLPDDDSMIGSAVGMAKDFLGISNNSDSGGGYVEERDESLEVSNSFGDTLDLQNDLQTKLASIQANLTDESTKAILNQLGNMGDLSFKGLVNSSKYYKKSIELKYRHLLEAKTSNKLLEKMISHNDSFLTAIAKNTALPEFAKKLTSEAMVEIARQKMGMDLYDRMANSDILTNIKTNIGNKISKFRDGVRAGSEAIVTPIDLMNSMGGQRGMGKQVGGIGGDIFKGFIGNKLSKKFNETKLGKKFSDSMGKVLSNPDKLIEKLSSIPVAGKVFEFLGGLTKKDDMSIGELNHETHNPSDIMPFDFRTHSSINKVIPTLLSDILDEIRVINGLDRDKSFYDHNMEKFIKGSDKQKTIEEDLVKTFKQSGLDGSGKSILDDVLKHNKELELSKEEQGILLDRILKTNKDGVVDLYNIKEQDMFKDVEDVETKNRLDKAMINYSKDIDSDGNLLDTNKEAYKRMDNLSKFENSLDVSKLISDKIKNGYGDELVSMGIVTYDEPKKRYLINKDVYDIIVNKGLIDSVIDYDIRKVNMTDLERESYIENAKKNNIDISWMDEDISSNNVNDNSSNNSSSNNVNNSSDSYINNTNSSSSNNHNVREVIVGESATIPVNNNEKTEHDVQDKVNELIDNSLNQSTTINNDQTNDVRPNVIRGSYNSFKKMFKKSEETNNNVEEINNMVSNGLSLGDIQKFYKDKIEDKIPKVERVKEVVSNIKKVFVPDIVLRNDKSNTGSDNNINDIGNTPKSVGDTTDNASRVDAVEEEINVNVKDDGSNVNKNTKMEEPISTNEVPVVEEVKPVRKSFKDLFRNTKEVSPTVGDSEKKEYVEDIFTGESYEVDKKEPTKSTMEKIKDLRAIKNINEYLNRSDKMVFTSELINNLLSRGHTVDEINETIDSFKTVKNVEDVENIKTVEKGTGSKIIEDEIKEQKEKAREDSLGDNKGKSYKDLLLDSIDGLKETIDGLKNGGDGEPKKKFFDGDGDGFRANSWKSRIFGKKNEDGNNTTINNVKDAEDKKDNTGLLMKMVLGVFGLLTGAGAMLGKLGLGAITSIGGFALKKGGGLIASIITSTLGKLLPALFKSGGLISTLAKKIMIGGTKSGFNSILGILKTTLPSIASGIAILAAKAGGSMLDMFGKKGKGIKGIAGKIGKGVAGMGNKLKLGFNLIKSIPKTGKVGLIAAAGAGLYYGAKKLFGDDEPTVDDLPKEQRRLLEHLDVLASKGYKEEEFEQYLVNNKGVSEEDADKIISVHKNTERKIEPKSVEDSDYQEALDKYKPKEEEGGEPNVKASEDEIDLPKVDDSTLSTAVLAGGMGATALATAKNSKMSTSTQPSVAVDNVYKPSTKDLSKGKTVAKEALKATKPNGVLKTVKALAKSSGAKIGAKGALAVKGVARSIPFVGTALSLNDAYNEVSNGDYGKAMFSLVNAALMAVPVTALVGTIASVGKGIYDVATAEDEKPDSKEKEKQEKMSREEEKEKQAEKDDGLESAYKYESISNNKEMIVNEPNDVYSSYQSGSKRFNVKTTYSSNYGSGGSSSSDYFNINTDELADKYSSSTANIMNTKGITKSFKINDYDKVLLEQIARHESKVGDAGYRVTYGNNVYLPNKQIDITKLPISEVYKLMRYQIKETRRRKAKARFVTSAMGKYQFLIGTLRDLVKQTGTSTNTYFNKSTQDYLILHRLKSLRGYTKWINKEISDRTFVHKLSLEFASIEDPYKGNGKGHYAGQKAPNTAKKFYKAFAKMRALMEIGKNKVEEPDSVKLGTNETTKDIKEVNKDEVSTSTKEVKNLPVKDNVPNTNNTKGNQTSKFDTPFNPEFSVDSSSTQSPINVPSLDVNPIKTNKPISTIDTNNIVDIQFNDSGDNTSTKSINNIPNIDDMDIVNKEEVTKPIKSVNNTKTTNMVREVKDSDLYGSYGSPKDMEVSHKPANNKIHIEKKHGETVKKEKEIISQKLEDISIDKSLAVSSMINNNNGTNILGETTTTNKILNNIYGVNVDMLRSLKILVNNQNKKKEFVPIDKDTKKDIVTKKPIVDEVRRNHSSSTNFTQSKLYNLSNDAI